MSLLVGNVLAIATSADEASTTNRRRSRSRFTSIHEITGTLRSPLTAGTRPLSARRRI